jgi:hypothetical protein
MAEPLFDRISQATTSLKHLLGKAVLINKISPEKFDLSFTRILVAFHVADDPISHWFKDYVEQAGVAFDDILAYKKLDHEKLEEIAKHEPPEEFPKRPPSMTSSAKIILTKATELMQAVSRGEEANHLDVHHLMGAYIYHPGAHESQLKSWNFDSEAWSNAFLTQIKAHFPDEYDRWTEVHTLKFGNPPTPVPEPMSGLSTHIARDRWTLDDALGYNAYAYVIYRFLTHPETKPPLTISIQAPWGGGKTSLMRMIQKRLDKKALKSYEEQGTTPSGGADEQRTTDKLKVKQVRDELKILIHEEEPPFSISDAERKDMQRLTIWFNVWEYESTEQVWAGLADAIVRQFAKRLGPIEREKFWLYLHMRRLDADKIRRTIYERIMTFWWHRMYPWLVVLVSASVGSAALAIAGGTFNNPLMQSMGFGGITLSFLVGAIQAFMQYRAVNNEPAEISLGEYVQVPDYSAKLGFVHHVKEDLQRVFEVIEKIGKHSPMVIFIDDLDRCSPEKVADVVEAINLFLGGEFQNCMFVLGMDPEMVAAALEEAHSKVIAKLPADAMDTPIGWRFMDKFVQLPFVIPPAEMGDLENYARSLLSGRIREGQIDEQVSVAANDATPELGDPKKIEQTAQELAEKHNLNDDQQRGLTRILEQRASFNIMKRGIDSFSDQDSEIREIVLNTAPEFSSNPRELKRFFNMFRFLFFLKWAREGRGQPSPSLDQLRRWVKLSLKWPEVVRWLRRSYGGREEWTQRDKDKAIISATATRLRQLEDIAKNNDLKAWQAVAKEELQLEVENRPWIADKSLMEFFHEEYNLNEKDRLSDAAGKGLW